MSEETSSRVERVAFVTVALMSTVTATAVLYRTFFPHQAAFAVRSAPEDALVHVPEWKQLLDHGVLMGDSAAPVQIVEFADLECPFCRQFHAVFEELAAERSDVALTFIHYPLNKHRFARPAAHAAECALDHGRFRELVKLVYEGQDSLGLKSWTTYAAQAGIADTTAFASCVSSREPRKRIDLGLRAGAGIGVNGTPTVIINGWRITRPPYTRAALETTIDDVLSRNTPGVP